MSPKISIDESICCNCESCVSIAPNTFESDGGIYVVDSLIDDSVIDAFVSCPCSAISLT